jgi:hypothetical protein
VEKSESDHQIASRGTDPVAADADRFVVLGRGSAGVSCKGEI